MTGPSSRVLVMGGGGGSGTQKSKRLSTKNSLNQHFLS